MRKIFSMNKTSMGLAKMNTSYNVVQRDVLGSFDRLGGNLRNR